MPVELQVKLLRVLEMGKIVRIGGERELPVDVRLIAATNRDPHEAVAQQKLRQDLLYRLSVFPLQLPPLRERGADIDLLAEYFLSHMNRAEKADKRLGRAALERMRAYHWPGNVRELKNVMDRAFILADQVITTECLPALSGDATPTSAEPVGLGPAIELKPGISIGEAEKRLIFATLEACNGNKERAARVLEISLKTLYNRLNAYNGRGKQRPASAAGPQLSTPPSS
jgi:DNA-binding NtrC family response regulator